MCLFWMALFLMSMKTSVRLLVAMFVVSCRTNGITVVLVILYHQIVTYFWKLSSTMFQEPDVTSDYK